MTYFMRVIESLICWFIQESNTAVLLKDVQLFFCGFVQNFGDQKQKK